MAAWFTFISIVLSLLAAVLGSAIGQHRAAVRAKSEIAAETVVEKVETDETTP
jgi:hypothetical protein